MNGSAQHGGEKAKVGSRKRASFPRQMNSTTYMTEVKVGALGDSRDSAENVLMEGECAGCRVWDLRLEG